MPKVLLINSSPHPQGCTYTALREVADTLEKNGVTAEIYQVGTKPIAGCIACNACAARGKCVFGDNDGVNAIAARLEEFDGIIVGAPVYYGGPAAQLCAFLDRLFYSAGGKMAGKLGAAVVSCRRGGSTASFDRLNKYFTISNMHVVGSQYWNQVHGFTADDVRRDAEGLQTMRVLGQNMAWLLRCIEAGRKAGVEPPVYEPRVFTHFHSIEG